MSGGHGHGHGDHGDNKRVALVISLLALVLAFSQAKTIRQTVLRTAAEQTKAHGTSAAGAEQVKKWQDTAQRYQSEPETNEGRDQLAARAKAAEKKRDVSMAAYHHYELASAA